jgi:hypothetical protein
VSTAFVDYFRCPSEFAAFDASELAEDKGFFTFDGATCYGRRRAGSQVSVSSGLPDVTRDVECDRTGLRLPFDLSEVVSNLRYEHYFRNAPRYLERVTGGTAARSIYYFFRPILPVAVRKHLQKVRLSGWDKIAFPRWPVDLTVDSLMSKVMALELKQLGIGRIPFIWFWPDGARGCGILTHDVEDRAGRDFCDRLMDLDDSYGIKSAFQIVPEARYEKSVALCMAIRRRGFEVNVHDLNHDGRLFHSRQQFLRRAAEINDYARAFQSLGFRSASLYRQQGWYGLLEFSYDMSVPNVAHLEPQRGGCCTVMPYFVGDLLELPLTTAQDYSLFHILGDYSIALWKKQMDLILSRNGLISVLTHPDYLIERRARAVYMELLAYLRKLQEESRVWMALPAEVNRWWRSRYLLKLVRDGPSWRIEGPDHHRARLAYASLRDNRLVFDVDGAETS